MVINMGSVYIAISPSNKKYVGVTSQNTNERWKEHTQRARENRVGALYNAIRKYGVESFMKFTLFESDDWGILCEKEKELIIENNTMYPNGYNLTSGGEGAPGMVVSEDARKRMSEGQKKRFQNPEQRALLNECGKKARSSNSEKFAKIRAQKRKDKDIYLSSPEFKKFHSDKTKEGMLKVKERLVECAKQRAANPDWRKKISESKKGQGLGSKRSEEQKKKQSEARKRWWANKKSK